VRTVPVPRSRQESCHPVALSRNLQKSVLPTLSLRYSCRIAHKWRDALRDVFIAWSITFIAFSGCIMKGIYFVESAVLQMTDSFPDPLFTVRVV
jgi:hypothetical protein